MTPTTAPAVISAQITSVLERALASGIMLPVEEIEGVLLESAAKHGELRLALLNAAVSFGHKARHPARGSSRVHRKAAEYKLLACMLHDHVAPIPASYMVTAENAFGYKMLAVTAASRLAAAEYFRSYLTTTTSGGGNSKPLASDQGSRGLPSSHAGDVVSSASDYSFDCADIEVMHDLDERDMGPDGEVEVLDVGEGEHLRPLL